MKYPQDFQLSYPKLGSGVDFIDSYEQLISILRDLEKYELEFSLDNSLPLIEGDLNNVLKVLKKFISETISQFKSKRGTAFVVFKKDCDSSFISYLVENKFFGDNGNVESNLVDTITKFHYAICKEPLMDNESIKTVSIQTQKEGWFENDSRKNLLN
ncbi:hypothetical protein [Algoriphagus winogradskyi]|uniref:Uncharacterized protein n=1 Tax=Algoriphagus winogradskyi TaxID=237017 RepID=A0ABY1PE17_9BACT|nr:hypothetical protein [Algoriphagus winogradskyi]SMP32378.1 hypothetical protein SAMN06265367_1084 [Algoriphagus winogradskyi]